MLQVKMHFFAWNMWKGHIVKLTHDNIFLNEDSKSLIKLKMPPATQLSYLSERGIPYNNQGCIWTSFPIVRYGCWNNQSTIPSPWLYNNIFLFDHFRVATSLKKKKPSILSQGTDSRVNFKWKTTKWSERFQMPLAGY